MICQVNQKYLFQGLFYQYKSELNNKLRTLIYDIWHTNMSLSFSIQIGITKSIAK